MKYLIPILFLLVGCASERASSLKASDLHSFGGDKGNGAEYIDDVYRSAWYRGAGSIHACVVIDPNFGISKEAVWAAISNAESSWWDYIHGKGIDVDIRLLNTWHQNDMYCQFENRFTYYFGGEPPEVKEAKVKFENPVAFAKRTSFDIAKGESTGFIWVANQGALSKGGVIFPNWSLTNNLAGILRHEIGHVYGVDHVPQTIMDERVADFLKLSDKERKERLSGIDSYHDLYICLQCPVSRSGSLGFQKATEPNSVEENFQALVGHPPVGPVLARVEGQFTNSVKLIVDDFGGRYEFTLDFGDQKSNAIGMNSRGSQVGIFRTAKLHEEKYVVVSAIDHGSQVLYGSLTTKTGDKIPLIVELNMTTKVDLQTGQLTIDGLVIKTFKQGLPQILFFAVAY